jgi:anion transporter
MPCRTAHGRTADFFPGDSGMPKHGSAIAGWAVAAAATALFCAPAFTGADAGPFRTAAVVLLTMGLLATGALPEYLTSLLFFLFAMAFAIAPPHVVFSGFATSTLWLVFGGLIVAEAVNSTGLGSRVAAAVLGRITLSYTRLIGLAVAFSTVLAFFMPATLGRILLLLPLFSAIAVQAGLTPGGKAHNGVCLAVIMTTYQCGTAILPANTPNLVLTGAAENLYGQHISYAEYLLVQFPVMGLVKAALIFGLICLLMQEDIRQPGAQAPHGPVRPEELRLAAILLGSLALWATDFVHGIQPGWIALGAGVLCLLPRVGVIPLAALNERVRLGPVFYIAAILGLGATISETGLATDIGSRLSKVLDLRQGHDFLNFMMLATMSSVAGLLTTNPVQPALLTPLAAQLAEAMDWPLKATLMSFALGFTTMILPYQVPPVAVGLQIAGLPLRAALRFTVPLALISLLVLVPLDYAWWKLIGYLP